MDQSVNYNCIKKRKSLVSLTAREKLQILDELDIDCNIIKVAEKYRVDSSTLRKWKKNRAKIEATYEISANSKRCKWSPNKSLNDAVFLWFQKMKTEGILVSGTIIKEKAIKFHKKIGGSDNFVASTGWLDWWKKKYNIKKLGSRINGHSKNCSSIQNTNKTLTGESLENLIIKQVLEETRNYENYTQDPLSTENYKKTDSKLGDWTKTLRSNKNGDIQETKTIQIWLNESIYKQEKEDLEEEKECEEETSKIEDEREEKIITTVEALEGLHKIISYCQQNAVISETEMTTFNRIRLLLESKIN